MASDQDAVASIRYADFCSLLGGGNKEEWGLKVLVIFLDAIKAFYLEGAIREGSKNDTAIQTSTLVGQMLGTPAVLQELGGIKQLLQSQPGMEQRA